MKKIISLILILLFVTAVFCSCNNTGTTKESMSVTESTVSASTEGSALDELSWPAFQEYTFNADTEVKNIILVIGDGMGENTIKNAEIVKGEKLLMQGLENTCHVTTDSLDGTTDSAASSTAMSCGIKTHNQFIGVDKDGKDVESICEFAMSRGLKTGLVVSQIINHATPAGMIAHTDYRGLYNVIIKHEVLAGVDVLFGGGSEYYTKSLKKKADEKGYTYITKENELLDLTYSEDQKVLGLFAYNALYAGTKPSLATMTDKALELLTNDKGFFMMVEGSNIDIQLQNEDMAKTMEEMTSFDQTIDVILRYAKDHEGTLVIITADHETGGVILPDSMKSEDVNNDLITNGGEHTSTPVLLMAAGAKADVITENETIENTDISKYMREFLNATYGEAPVKILNHNNDTGETSETSERSSE